eukprot:2308588-Prymnesium_polylepis.1
MVLAQVWRRDFGNLDPRAITPCSGRRTWNRPRRCSFWVTRARVHGTESRLSAPPGLCNVSFP